MFAGGFATISELLTVGGCVCRLGTTFAAGSAINELRSADCCENWIGILVAEECATIPELVQKDLQPMQVHYSQLFQTPPASCVFPLSN